MDFCMTSPPYMPRHHKWNPLCEGDPAHMPATPRICAGIGRIFVEVARIMKRGSSVVVQADNLPGRTFTPLVRDLSLAIGEVLRLETEIVVAWQGGPENFRHTHCLVFKAA